MGVGDDDSEQRLAPFRDERRVWQYDVDARKLAVVEADAEVDDDPLAVEAVEVEVHADLAGTAQRHEHEVVRMELRSTGGRR